MNGEPLDLDALLARSQLWSDVFGDHRTYAVAADDFDALIAECRALRAENDDLSAIHDDLSEDTARLRAEVEQLRDVNTERPFNIGVRFGNGRTGILQPWGSLSRILGDDGHTVCIHDDRTDCKLTGHETLPTYFVVFDD